MSYIGYSHAANHIAPPHTREVLTPDGSATYFDLLNDVPGYHEANVTVVVNNVIQEPVSSYTIINDGNSFPRRLDFAGVALASTDSLYVIHQGIGTMYNTPAAGSVTKASMAANMVSHVVDKFLGSDATSGSTVLALSEAPTNRDAISVYVNGVYQRSGATSGENNYTISSSNLTFSSALTSTDQIDVHHHTFRSTTTKVADASVGTTQLASGAVTSAKLATNIAIGGTLGVTGAATLSSTFTGGGLMTTGGNIVIPNAGNIGSATTPAAIAIASNGLVTIAGNLTVSGTTTTVDTTLTLSDALVINNAGSDVGLLINSTSTGNIIQLQNGGADKFVITDANTLAYTGAATITGSLAVTTTLVVTTTSTFTGLMTANGGLDTDTNSKVKQKGAFMQSSTHQALILGL